MRVNNVSYTTPNSIPRLRTESNRVDNYISFSSKGNEFCKQSKSLVGKIVGKLKQIFRELPDTEKKVEKPAEPFFSSKGLTPLEKIDGSDFYKLKGETVSWSGEKIIKDNDGNIIRKLHSNNKMKLSYAMDFDPTTGRVLRGASYTDDGILNSTIEYDPKTGNFYKYQAYQNDGKRIALEIEYDVQTEDIIRRTWYNDDGITIKKVKEYKPFEE